MTVGRGIPCHDWLASVLISPMTSMIREISGCLSCFSLLFLGEALSVVLVEVN